MDKIKELYQKVAADNVLLEKFQAILKDAEAAGKKATEEKLIAFAKEAGYDVTIEEVQAFGAQSKGELNDDELDVVAGGKLDPYKLFNSIATFGIGCAVASFGIASGGGDCGEYFQE